MANGKVMFFVRIVTDLDLEGDAFFQVQAKPGWTVARLLGELRNPQNEPSELLKGISRQSTFYTVKVPIEYDDENRPDISRASLRDEDKYTKIGNNKFLKNIAQEFIEEYLYLVIVDVPDGTGPAVDKLMQKHAELFRCLTINVKTSLHWTKNDVISNRGIFLDDNERTKPSEMVDLEVRLCKQRFFTIPDTNRNLSIARSYSRQFELTYIHNTQPQDHATVKNSLEFLAFYNLLCCYHPDALRYKEAKSSSLKTTAMKSNFILPPFFTGRESTDALAYHEGASWKFPLFVKCGAMARLPRTYIPKNDFCVWFQKFDLPLIIGEVVSTAEGVRYRMLLHAVALARLVFALRKPGSTKHPFIVAVYLTRRLTAERYIMMKPQSEPDEVFISHQKFDLAEEDGAITFQREMYNLASVLEFILNHDELDHDKCSKLQVVKEDALGMKSLHTSGACTKPNKAGSKGQNMDSIPEAPGSQADDDLGVFDDENVRAALNQMKYKVAYVAFGYSNIAPLVSRIDGKMVGCLKFVKDGAKGKEIEILQYLAGQPSESNHTVRPFGIWPVTGGSIIAMPAAGNDLTSLTDPDTHLWSLTAQLFEAVKFMHDHSVAHLDLKPSNILVPSDYGRLTVIDFGVSVRLRTQIQLLQGHVGTEGYIAPEVGQMKFSPIRADLWSIGKVVRELCLLCGPSASRDWLLDLSEQLLDDDPSKRPMMSEVLQWMLNTGF